MSTAGTVHYLVPLPAQGLTDESSAIEHVTRTLTSTRTASWNYIADPVLGRAQTGILVVEQASPWDLVVAAEVSERLGGFVLVSELHGTGGTRGTALLYAGRLLRAWRRNATGRPVLRVGVRDVPDDAEADSFALTELVTGRTPGTLHPSWALASGVATAVQPTDTPPPAAGLPPARASFTQVVLTCDEDRWRAALDRREDLHEDDGWRWRPDRTPEAQVPFVMLRGPGPLRPQWVAELALATGGFAAAAEVRSQQPLPQDGVARPVPWAWAWLAPGEDLSTGYAEDGVEAVEVWHDVATVLGSYTATLSWPASDRGHPLVGTGRVAPV